MAFFLRFLFTFGVVSRFLFASRSFTSHFSFQLVFSFHFLFYLCLVFHSSTAKTRTTCLAIRCLASLTHLPSSPDALELLATLLGADGLSGDDGRCIPASVRLEGGLPLLSRHLRLSSLSSNHRPSLPMDPVVASSHPEGMSVRVKGVCVCVGGTELACV